MRRCIGASLERDHRSVCVPRDWGTNAPAIGAAAWPVEPDWPGHVSCRAVTRGAAPPLQSTLDQGVGALVGAVGGADSIDTSLRTARGHRQRVAETTFPGERRCVGVGIGRSRLGAVVVAASPVRDRQGSMTVRRTDVASMVTVGIVSAGPGAVCSLATSAQPVCRPRSNASHGDPPWLW